jgi:isopropylmalate/homocitrate/citramalate synthase
MRRPPKQPWLTDHWAASQHNFAPEIAVAPRPVALHDITIRDGEECADLVYSTQDKIRIAEALARAGIRRTELFLTAPGWLETVRAIVQRCPQLDLYVTWQPGRTERVMDMGVRHVMVWYRIGDVWQECVSKRPRQDLMDEMLAGVRAAHSAGCEVNLFLPEMTRASLEHILTAARAAEQAGATAATVVDSQSSARPAAIAYLVRQVKAATNLNVEVHCHNDFGLAVANVLAAYEAGADALNVTVNGVGYRAGNAALEEVVMALEALYGVDTGIRLDMLPELSRLVEEITGIPTGYFKPVVGRGAFAYEQWGFIAAHTAAGKRQYAFPYAPDVVGRSPRLHIGKWSDVGAVIQKLAECGLSAPPDLLPHILLRSQRESVARRRPLRDDEFLAIAEGEGAQSCEP